MSYRDDLAALTARHAALARELADKRRELGEAATLLAEAQARARLPVLDNIRVAAPCTADWNAMPGDERVRHCGDCNKSVYNLSGMTREEAQALLVARDGRLCVRYFQRADGTVMTKDCAVGVKRRKRRLRVVAASATLAIAGAVSWKVYEDKTQVLGALHQPDLRTHHTMGKVSWAEPDGFVDAVKLALWQAGFEPSDDGFR